MHEIKLEMLKSECKCPFSTLLSAFHRRPLLGKKRFYPDQEWGLDAQSIVVKYKSVWTYKATVICSMIF